MKLSVKLSIGSSNGIWVNECVSGGSARATAALESDCAIRKRMHGVRGKPHAGLRTVAATRRSVHRSVTKAGNARRTHQAARTVVLAMLARFAAAFGDAACGHITTVQRAVNSTQSIACGSLAECTLEALRAH